MTGMSLLKRFLKLARIQPEQGEQGFTLLEVVIAMAIMVITFASILAVEGGALNASARAKQMNIVAMLAKNKMVETEFKFEGKAFTEVKTEEAGTFEDPYQDYRWKSSIKEMKFPNLGMAASKPGGGGPDQFTEMLTRLISNFFSKAIREVSVTVLWKKGAKDQTYTLSTFWVDLNYEFQLTE
jgi:type II secretion system protein I